MQGFVSHEKQKFERLAQEMKSKEKDLLVKNETLKRVEALIKNSPVVRNKKPLQETNTTKNETVSKQLYLALGGTKYVLYVCSTLHARKRRGIL